MCAPSRNLHRLRPPRRPVRNDLFPLAWPTSPMTSAPGAPRRIIEAYSTGTQSEAPDRGPCRPARRTVAGGDSVARRIGVQDADIDAQHLAQARGVRAVPRSSPARRRRGRCRNRWTRQVAAVVITNKAMNGATRSATQIKVKLASRPADCLSPEPRDDGGPRGCEVDEEAAAGRVVGREHR